MAAIDPGNCEQIAATLLAEFRSLARIWAQSPEAPSRVLPAWPSIVPLLLGARDAMLEGMAADLGAAPIDPFDPALRRYLIAAMGSLPEEHLRVLFLDPARRLIADEQLQRGSLGQLAIYPRTIFRRALEHNAAAIILVHNHPSGDPNPSDEDISATRKLDQIGRALDVAILDHMIVTSAQVHHIMSEDAIAGMANKPARYMLRSPIGAQDDDPDERILQNARVVARRRLLRRQLLGASDLFGEPAWDMLLDLFIQQCEGRLLPMSSLCLSADIPNSSAMKLIQRLCDAGLLERWPDPHDGRRSLIKISPDTEHRLRAYFAEGTE